MILCMNPISFSRRAVLSILPAVALKAPSLALAAPESLAEGQLAAIESRVGARLGVAAINTGTGRKFSHRASELFAMCSTFKFLLAACVLRKIDAGTENLKRLISYNQKDLLEYAPVTRAHVQEGAMTVGDLCAAAVELSDNTAANLLLAQIGGPAGLTQFIRSLGNQVTRLDRIEPDLNTAMAGDPRDTTSPAAMLDSMEKLLTGSALSTVSSTQLISWMEQCTTGKNRLRAGFPANWRAGDKTGTGEHGAVGDIGIFWPPGKSPILVAAYIMEGNAPAHEREQAIAAVGQLAAQTL
jgi:beta-lactamase class A